MKLVLYSNAGLRPDSTCMYFVWAFEALLGKDNVRHIQTKEELDSLDGTEADLYLKVDDGQEWQRWDNPKLHPSAYYIIDTHLDMEWRQKLAREAGFDYLFLSQKKGVNVDGWHTGNRLWLPLACDPTYHDVGPQPKKYDLCFMGNFHSIYGLERMDYVDAAFKAVDKPFYSRYRTFKPYTQKMAESKIVLNKSLNEDVNMRFFEATCSGSMLLSDILWDQHTLGFEDGVNYAGYTNKEEMLEKIKYYLAHDEERETIAAKGKALAQSKHTYIDRARRIVEMVVKEKVNV